MFQNKPSYQSIYELFIVLVCPMLSLQNPLSDVFYCSPWFKHFYSSQDMIKDRAEWKTMLSLSFSLKNWMITGNLAADTLQ